MTVMVVDDEQLALRKMVSQLCTIPEVEKTASFSDPFSALEWLREHPMDVALLDVEMYGMNGIELARACKELLPTLRIIFVTAYSQYALDAFRVRADGYLLKPVSTEEIHTELLRLPLSPDSVRRHGIYVQTFGNFELFTDGVPVPFTRAKSKELLAYLVDRKGAGITAAEVASVLWEDRPYDRSLQNQVQMIISDLMKSLRARGIERIVLRSRNSLSVDTETFCCDYYQFLRGDVNVINRFAGDYMSNYSWAEFTTGFLEQHA